MQKLFQSIKFEIERMMDYIIDYKFLYDTWYTDLSDYSPLKIKI